MEFIFIILSWMILLVPGFDDSAPPTGDKIFKIEYSDVVQSINTTSDESFDFWGFDIELKQNSGDILELKIPKNFPIPASFMGSWIYGNKPDVVVDNLDVNYEMEEDPCYFHYKIPVEGKTNVEIYYIVIATGTWQLYSPIQFEENDPCYNEVFYEKPHVSPLKQFKSGILLNEIQCRDSLILVTKYDGSPACTKPETKTKLIERGWGKPLSNISEIPLPKISQKDAVKIIENDLKNRVSNTTKILKIVDVIGDQDKYVPFLEFQTNNKIIPLVFVSNNDTLLTINNASLRINYLCNMGTIAYCGYMPPFNLDYKSHLVYGFDIVYGDNDSNMEPSFYAVDAVSGDIVDSGFLRNEAREK